MPDPGLPHQVVLPLTRGDVSDIRTGQLAVTCAPAPYGCSTSERIAMARLGAGDLVLSPTRGAIRSGAIRTHLHNATIAVNITTSAGALGFRVYVHAERQLVVVEGLSASGGESLSGLSFGFRPAPALPPGLFTELRHGASPAPAPPGPERGPWPG